MFCRNCGKEIPDQVRFCPACGCQLKQTSATPQQSVENPDQLINQQHVYNQSQATSQTAMQQQGMIERKTQENKQQTLSQDKVEKKWKKETGIINIIAGVCILVFGIIYLSVDAISVMFIASAILCSGIFHLCNIPVKAEALIKMIAGILAFLLGIFELDYSYSPMTSIAGGLFLFVSGLVLLACKNKKAAGITEFWLGFSLIFIGRISEEVYIGDQIVVWILFAAMCINGGTRWSFWRRKFESE